MGRKTRLETRHKRIAKDNAKTIEANSKGGRYYQPTVADKLAGAGVRAVPFIKRG